RLPPRARDQRRETEDRHNTLVLASPHTPCDCRGTWRDQPTTGKTILARLVDLDDPQAAEVDEHRHRKDYTISELVAIGEAREARDRANAAQRMIDSGKQGGRGKKKPSGLIPEGLEAGQSRDMTAAAVGLSWRTYKRAQAVVKAARDAPDLQDLV